MSPNVRVADRDQYEETRELVKTAFVLARSLGIRTLLVQADEITDSYLIEGLRKSERIVWIALDREHIPVSHPSEDIVLVMPEASLTRLSQLNLAIFLAALNRLVSPEQRVLGLSGVTGSQRLDTLVIAKPARDYPWLQHHSGDLGANGHLTRLLEIALQLAHQGREGSPIGTIFVLSGSDDLSPYLRQLILNPLEGHPAAARSIHSPALLETLRELAVLDGAFVISEVGLVESAAAYLNVSIGRERLTPGLGARHAAGLAITTVTDSTAVVISASSGTVSVYDHGETVLELARTPVDLRS